MSNEVVDNLLTQCVVGDRIRLPVAGSLVSRARQIPAVLWFGFTNLQLAEYALGDSVLFPLVWGIVRRGDGDELPLALSYLIPQTGHLRLAGDGYRRVMAGVREMRREWSEMWHWAVGLDLPEGDGIGARVFGMEMMKRFVTGCVAAGYDCRYEGGWRSGFGVVPAEDSPTGRHGFGVLDYGWAANFCRQPGVGVEVVGLGKKVVEEFDGWVTDLVGRQGVMTAVRYVVERGVEYLGQLGLEEDVWRLTMAPFEELGVPTSAAVEIPGMENWVMPSEIPWAVLYRVRGHVLRYFRSVYPEVDVAKATGRVRAVGGRVGLVQLPRFGGGGEVELAGISRARLGWMSSGLRRRFVEWVGLVSASFRELCGGGVGSLGGEARRFFRSLGFGLGDNFEVRFAERWQRRQVDEILGGLKSGVAGGGGGRRLGRLVREVVDQHMVALGLRSVYDVIEAGGYELRPVGHSGGVGYWRKVEDVAKVRIAAGIMEGSGRELSAPLELRCLDWGLTHRSSFMDRWWGDVWGRLSPDLASVWAQEVETLREQDLAEGAARKSGLYVPETLPVDVSEISFRRSWFHGMTDAWSRGIVCLEGAQRAFLEHVGVTLGEGDSGGKFWGELGELRGRNWARVPVWRWYLLREAYLASYVWAWAEFLHGGWAPLTPKWMRKLRRAAGVMASSLGVVTRGTGVPWWDGKPMENFMREEFGVQNYLSFLGSDFSGGRLRVAVEKSDGFGRLGEDEQDRLLMGAGYGFGYDGDTFRVSLEGMSRPDLVVEYALSAAMTPATLRGPGWYGYDSVTGRWRVVPAGKGVAIFGMAGRDSARAFQMLGNLFVAGQSRYVGVRLGGMFEDWVRHRGLSEVGIGMWSQFGLLGRDEWRSSPGMGGLFAGVLPGDDLSAFGTESFPRPYDFLSWVELGDGLMDVWRLVSRAPMSFPMAPMAALWNVWSIQSLPLAWVDRVLRAVVRGVDPVVVGSRLSEVPKGLVGEMSSEEREAFLRWRAKIWAPILSGDLGQVSGVGWSESVGAGAGHGVLREAMSAFWDTWHVAWYGGGEAE